MPTSDKKILVLPSWYPSRVDAFTGDFIQRHVMAVSIYCRQDVIYVIKDKTGNITKNVLIEEKAADNFSEKIIYYYSKKTGLPLLDKLLSQRKYNKLYRHAIKDYINKTGLPQLVHVHIAMKAGLQALWIKKKWNIPFILSEHWTAYLPEADFRINNFPLVYQRLLKTIFSSSSVITVVSTYLGKAIQQIFNNVTYTVIPNVVNTSVFFPVDKKTSATVKFIHISNMNYQKNTGAIIESLVYLKELNYNFELKLYGPVIPALQDLATQKGLSNIIFFNGEAPQAQLAHELQQSDALILYSRFETFGCVLIEANACGIPVIVSDIAVFHEIVEEGVNGFFVQGNEPKILAEKLSAFIGQKTIFNKEQIALTAADKYNYEKVGKQFVELYKQVSAGI